MLGGAAVVGQGVSLDVLASATATSVTDLLDLLDEAVRARVLAAPASPLGPYRFAHDLFRETLYDGMASSARVATHARVARALEEGGGDVSMVLVSMVVMALCPVRYGGPRNHPAGRGSHGLARKAREMRARRYM